MRCYPTQNLPPEMPIPAPTIRSPRGGRYTALIQMVEEADGGWVAITDPSCITGSTPKAKATTLHSAALARHIQVQTTMKNGYLYVREIAKGAAQDNGWVKRGKAGAN